MAEGGLWRAFAPEGKRYQFSFCVAVQVVWINTVVLGLGLLHILNQWVVRVLFYGVFFWQLWRRLKKRYAMGVSDPLYRLLTGTYGMKLFVSRQIGTVFGRQKAAAGKTRSRTLEYLLLLGVAVYGMIYFTYGAFQHPSYGFGDMYVHHSWVQGLIEGKIFLDGIYPQAMHCFVYCIHALFGIRLYSVMLFLAGIHVAVFLLSVYCLLREVFHWRYTPFFTLLLFLIIDVLCINEVYGMSRFQWTIVQEFGLYTLFLCACYLIRYLKSSHTAAGKGWAARYVWNENLFLFMMSLAASLTIHFYPTIMAFCLCAAFAVCMLKKVFSSCLWYYMRLRTWGCLRW